MHNADGAATAAGPHRRELWIAAVVFSALTGILTYPLSVRADHVVLADVPDIHLYIWTLGWIAHSLSTDPLTIFDANIFHPLTNTLAFSENLIGSGLIAAPIIWLTGHHILALNVVTLLSIALCGFGAYYLARRLGLGVSASFVCGIIYAFSPPRFFRIGQLHLTTVQWIPLALAFLHIHLARGRARDLKIFAALFTLQAITSGHGAVFLALTAAALFVYRGATGHAWAPVRRLRDLGIGGLLLLAPAVLVFVPYQIVQHEAGLRRTLENWTVPAVSFIASPTIVHEALVSLVMSISHVRTAAAYLFPGYLPLLLSALALGVPGTRWFARRATDYTTFYLLLAVTTLLLTVGPPLGLWPLVYWLPGFNFLRVPSRFLILTVLALAVLAGLGVERLRDLVERRRAGGGRWLGVAAATLLVVEFAAVPIAVTPFGLRPPAPHQWLADQPKPFAVAEVPLSGAPRDHSVYMLYSMAHWQKTVHGHSGFEPAQHTALYAAMRHFPDERCLDALRSHGVTYVVVHEERYRPEVWAIVKERLATAVALELVFRGSHSRVYRLR